MQEIQQIIYSSHKHFTFCWVPSHINTPGNALADQTTKEAINNVVAERAVPKLDYKRYDCKEASLGNVE